MRVALEQRALRLFSELLDLPVDTRPRWLAAVTDGDADLLRAVTALVDADRHGGMLPTGPPRVEAGTPDHPFAERFEAESAPDRLGNYRLVSELGGGGMGVVYLGERADGLFEQRVAVKLIRRQIAARGAAAFEAERRLLARLEHPGVARLIDGGVAADGRPWLATEYVAGTTIDVACAGRPLAERVRLLLQAARAARFAHGQLVAHGDLKPANILVGGDDRVTLLDFGVARLIGASGHEEARSYTPGFASPERAAGAPPGVADDVFALGRTLAAVIGDADRTDRELAAIAARATAPEPRRYPDVQALIEDLDHWLAHRPVRAVGGGGAYRARKFVARHRLGVFASLLAIAGLIGAATIAEVNHRQAERARAAEALRFADAHRTAHYLMFTLLDRLERQPGTLRLRVQVGAVAQRYLDRLAASTGAPREVRLDVARGYLAAAATAGMSNSPNLGDVHQATRDLAGAQTMLALLRREQPHWPALADPVARAASLDCQQHIYGNHDAARAIVAGRAGLGAVDAILGDPATRRRANWPIRICIGDALVWLNRSDRAIPLLTRELAAGRARRPRDAAMIERNLRILGEAYYYAGRFADGARVLEEAAAIQAAAHAAAPFYGPAINEASNVADDLASTYGEQHRHADQLRVAEGALALVRAQAALDADDIQSRRRALSLTRLVAGARAALGETGRAAAIMTAADRDWATLARRFPDDATTARLRLLAMFVGADMQRKAGHRDHACAIYRDAAAGWRTFARRWRLSPSDARENVGSLAQNVAVCAGRTGAAKGFIDG